MLLPFLLAAVATPVEARPLDGVALAQVLIRERVIIRISPARPKPERASGVRFATSAEPALWEEKKTVRCVAVRELAGAGVSHGGEVDLLMVDGARLRAKFDKSCPALDFYRGIYVKPTADGMICARRDVFRARSGTACPIGRLRTLELKKQTRKP